MTTALKAHPEAEDLGRFVEGTLDVPQRDDVIAHIADCEDCRILVVDAAEIIEPATVHSDRRWWLAVAAAVLLATVGTFIYVEGRDPLAKTKETYAQLTNRPIEARLSDYAYVPRRTMRGPGDEADPTLMILQGQAADATELHGQDAKALHARGLGLLLEDPAKAADSIEPLEAAAERDPNNVRYQSDLAAALIAAARNDPAKLQHALAVCDRALQIDSCSPEALYNRALALQLLDRTPDAIAAYERYLAVDPSSPWAGEVRQHLDLLRPSA